jgi:hypothetical protein
MHTAAFSPAELSTTEGSHQVLERGAHLREREGLYDPTFSRTVWRMYGGAKGLVVWYYLREREGHALAERLARGERKELGCL